MTTYKAMISINHRLIKGEVLSIEERESTINLMLSARSSPEKAHRFYQSVRFPNNIDTNGRRLYPIHYIPPYNENKKLKTVLNQTPKTHLFSANMYELEILRILFLLAPNNPDVQDMIKQTISRLKTTCFGNQDDGLGECFDTSLIVLRFISTVCSYDKEWILSRMKNYKHHKNDKKRAWFSEWYYWLCLSEMPFETAQPELIYYQDTMLNWLTNKSCVMNSDTDKIIHPVILCVLRNALCKFPDYFYIRDRKPFVCEKDGRLHFDMGGFG